MKKLILIIMGALFMASCATRRNYEARLDGYVGKSAEDVAQKWGAPTRVINFADGRRGLVYRADDEHNVREPADYRSLKSADVGCVTTFFLDQSGVITNWKWEGHACTSK